MVNEHSFILHKTPQDGKDFREPSGVVPNLEQWNDAKSFKKWSLRDR
jgi:hypothetical protein